MRSLAPRTLLISFIVAVTAAGCVAGSHGRALRGPFDGQVVDVVTGQPIPGAVVIAVWWEVVATPTQGNSRFYDAKEAVTGPDGRFRIPRAVPFWNLGVQPGQVTIFAPGYTWDATSVVPAAGPKFVVPTTVLMRRLQTRDERIKNLYGFPPAGVPDARIPSLIEAIRRERAALGLKP